jgi:YebC/PmpR family DNA-binding regulatory protein
MGRLMAIEGRKNAQDAKRGKIFTKLIRELTVAARAGGSDAKSNPRLRTATDKALAMNMSRDVIERAVKKATGELEGVEYEEIRYEGYAPGGIAVIVDCMTDNKVRTVADVRHAFSKNGGNLGTDGSVAFMFRKLGVLAFPGGSDEDAVTNVKVDVDEIPEGDALYASIEGEEDMAAATIFHHNPAHRWWYFPDMTADEVIFIKFHDSDHDRAWRAPHTAFHDTSRPDAVTRESYEFRAIAYFA